MGLMRKLKGGTKPETRIQKAIIKFLRAREWCVKETHGNMYQSGFPDLYACHLRYGSRWIEIKQSTGYKFTPAQLETFPEWASKGVGVWIMTGANEEEYKKLFKPANWNWYLQIMK